MAWRISFSGSDSCLPDSAAGAAVGSACPAGFFAAGLAASFFAGLGGEVGVAGADASLRSTST